MGQGEAAREAGAGASDALGRDELREPARRAPRGARALVRRVGRHVVLAALRRGPQQPHLHLQPHGRPRPVGARTGHQAGRGRGEAHVARAGHALRGREVGERPLRGLRRQGAARLDARRRRALRRRQRADGRAAPGADVDARVQPQDHRRPAPVDRHGHRRRRAHRQEVADHAAEGPDDAGRPGAVARAPLAGGLAGVPARGPGLAGQGAVLHLRVARRQAGVRRRGPALPGAAQVDPEGVLRPRREDRSGCPTRSGRGRRSSPPTRSSTPTRRSGRRTPTS